MKCDRVSLPGGGFAIVCGHRGRRHSCASCGADAGYQCDWKLGGGPAAGQGRTCDAWICGEHAREVAPGKHLCPTHQAAYQQWLERRAARPAQITAEKPGSTI